MTSLAGLINYSLILTIFALNFLANPVLKWVSLVYVAFIYAAIFAFDLKKSLPIIIGYCFLEGQGRILWEYNPFFRISFDLLIALAILRGFLVKREIRMSGVLPKPLLLLIALHFLWYVVEVFNVSSIDLFLPLAATKVYVFPFMFFVFLRHNENVFDKETINKISGFVLFMLSMEVALSLVQYYYRQDFILALSPYYERPLKGGNFSNIFFRPFGTTHLPGGISIYLALSTGLLYLRDKFTKKQMMFITTIILLVSATLIICQVRSALVKFVLINMGAFFSVVINSDNKAKNFFLGLILLTFSAFGISYYVGKNSEQFNQIINLEAGLKRWEKVKSYESLKAKRAGPIDAFNIAVSRLEEYPFGLGPGMTAAGHILTEGTKSKFPMYNKNTFWAYDNYFLSLIVEFGYGAIFYILFILSLPLLLLSRFRTLYNRREFYASRIVMVSFFQIIIILLGNWGAIGISYNPESFFFWFWVALGLNVYDLSTKNVSLAEAIDFHKDDSLILQVQ